MTIFEVIPQVLLSPYVIGVVLFIIIYGSILSTVASGKEHVRKIVPKRPAKTKKLVADKPALTKNADISDLGLD